MIPLASKYQVLCQAVSHKSFTEAAKVLHHSQSAVSQAVKAVEQEVGLTLVLRKKDGIELTSDGKKVYPYIQNICDAELALAHKTFEMEQLQGGIVRIGTFPTVSCEALATLMKQFKAEHPSVRFVLYQGEYTSIASMLQSGKVEIGFSHLGFCEEFEAVPLFRDPLAAVLPPEHSLRSRARSRSSSFRQSRSLFSTRENAASSRTPLQTSRSRRGSNPECTTAIRSWRWSSGDWASRFYTGRI